MLETQQALYDECIARLASTDARTAFQHLVATSAVLPGFSCELRRKGYLMTYRYMQGDAIPFAFIVNRNSLLFYFRKAAMTSPAANVAALSRSFQDVKLNNRGEIQLRVASESQARQLMRIAFNA